MIHLIGLRALFVRPENKYPSFEDATEIRFASIHIDESCQAFAAPAQHQAPGVKGGQQMVHCSGVRAAQHRHHGEASALTM